MCQALHSGCGLGGGEDGYDPHTQAAPHQVKAGAVGDAGVLEVLRLPGGRPSGPAITNWPGREPRLTAAKPHSHRGQNPNMDILWTQKC